MGKNLYEYHPLDAGFSSGSGSTSVTSSLMNSMGSNTSVFYQLPASKHFEVPAAGVKAGRWPESQAHKRKQASKYGTVTDYALYSMGLRDPPSWTR